MDFITKIVEILFKKQWIVTVVSLLMATPFLTVIPTDFYDKLPFESHDINVIVAYSFIVLTVYVIILFILSLINRLHTNKKRKIKRQRDKDEMIKLFEQIKSDIDKLSDLDYSIIMYLIENENKIPYKLYRFRNDNTILDNPRFFLSSPFSGESKQYIVNTAEGEKTFISNGKGTQYLLTNEYYNLFCAIIDETGSITHFSKKRVDLNQ